MSPQREILPQVMQAILGHHPDCSIVLIGSVARREERPENSDIDLNIFLSRDDVSSPWVSPENRWQLQVKSVMDGIRIDVAWETFDFLNRHLDTEGPFWILSFGEILHDPSQRVEPCLQRARQWASEHAELCDSIESDFRIAKAKQLAKYRSNDGKAM